jgi:hypothetical protein
MKHNTMLTIASLLSHRIPLIYRSTRHAGNWWRICGLPKRSWPETGFGDMCHREISPAT